MKALSSLGLLKYCLFKNYPAQVIFFVTARCNMRCRMCFYWRSVERADNSFELTLDEISRISRNMKPFFWLMIGGGEPFLRKDLPEICGIFSKNNSVRNISIPTNGFDTPAIIAALEDIFKRIGMTYLNVNFSLDGIGEGHDEIRGVPGAFDRVITSFNSIKKLKRSYPNLGVGINIVYSSLNQERILDLTDYVTDTLKPDNLALIFVRGQTRDMFDNNIDLETYRAITDKITLEMIKGKLPFYSIPFKDLVYAKDILMRDIIYRTKKTGLYQIPCLAGRLSIVISEEGQVFPCELRTTPLGNLRESGYDLSRILTRDNINKLKKGIQKDRCFCTHECFYTMNILFNPRLHPQLFREWIGLKLRKLYAAFK